MWSVRHSLVLTVTLAASSAHSAEAPLRVVMDAAQRPIAVEGIPGWTKEELARLTALGSDNIRHLSERLRLHVLDSQGHPQQPPLAGTYEIVGDAVRFTPQFSLRPGTNYRAEYFPPTRNSSESPVRHAIDIRVPALPPSPPTRVTAVYPSAEALPENQLRFYVHFSAPMAAGDAYVHVKLLKSNGEAVHRPFLEIGEELWDGTGTRLTLLFDPGRVKKGLAPREMFGPVLEAGQTYRLVIDKVWRDANGNELAEGFEKRITAGPAIETAIDSKQWQIVPPAAGTRDALVIRFPRSLDRALSMRMINLAGPDGRTITGDVSVSDEEKRWECRPDEPWQAGNYTLVIDTALEDSAGNNLARPFEVDVFDRVDDRAGPELLRIPFAIRGR